MTEPTILVERCVVRVLRRGGWSWGPHPRDLPPAIVQAVADLIAARYAGEPAGGEDVEITEPVTIVVPVSAATLRAAPGRWPVLAAAALHASRPGPGPTTVFVESPHTPTFAQWPGGAARAPAGPGPAYQVLHDPDGGITPARSGRDDEAAGAGATSFADLPPAVALARLLAEIRAQGNLAELLDLLPEQTLSHYAAVLGGVHPEPAHPEAGPPAVPRAATGAATDPATGTAPEPAGSHPDKDVAVVAAPAPQALPDGGKPVTAHGTARRRLADAAALPADTPDGRALAAALTSRYGPPAEATTTAPHDAPPVRLGTVEVRSAVPFLVAAALARIGVLDRIGTALTTAGLAADAPLLATALAYQALGPLERGWRRPPTDRHDAAAFAGLAAGRPEPDLAAFARRARTALPLIDALLGLAVAAGHEPGRPLVVTRVAAGHGDGLLLAEADGAFPIAWTTGADGLVPGWRAAGRPLTLIAGPALGTAPARALAAAGVALCAAFPPSRGERWHRLPGRRRLWATDPAAEPPADVDFGLLAETLDRQMADAAARAAVPLDHGGPLQRTVTLAAGIGLATIAWQLWRDREPTEATLAAERFGDLSAVVTHTPDEVRVRLPLGRRHADLDRCGLLADVPGAFWLGGRTLRFSGG
ncbi:hypothetical protein DMB66_19035 [Actinoplanes sp. ATCC 53533]|uniref:hypothetical protein n=1 Tax=Actinoplanes sp. ATCC 53533 TaxID=1288362 RepID=UPI000F7986BB|nr:hypothetical protein [Actinoplanes sp. ATCC 53533]RSM64740.1 hypothetical protein DMB66_19035 [Actinoplanes sp. ATCC 53533]